MKITIEKRETAGDKQNLRQVYYYGTVLPARMAKPPLNTSYLEFFSNLV